MGIKICPQCSGKVSDSRNDCPHCNYDFTSIKKCPDCEEQIDACLTECPICGHVFLQESNEQASAIIQTAESEKNGKKLACPYCDSTDSMQISNDWYMCVVCRNKYIDTSDLPVPPLAQKAPTENAIIEPSASVAATAGADNEVPPPENKVTNKNTAVIWMWASLAFTAFFYLTNVIISLCIDGNLMGMFQNVLDGYIAGFICMCVGITGYIISLFVLLKDERTKVAKIVSLILMVAILCVTFSPLVLHDPLTYERNDDGTYSVVDCEYNATNVKIPSTHNSAPVTRIGDHAFYSCPSLTSITIPNSVTSISSKAFDGCYSLSKINYLGTIDDWAQYSFSCYFNAGGWVYTSPLKYADLYINDELVTNATISRAEISSGAFSRCDSLESVTLEDSVTTINGNAFWGCSLSTIVIPESVTYIGSDAFRGCDSLVIYCEKSSEPEEWSGAWNRIGESYWSEPVQEYYATVFWAGEWEYDSSGNPVPIN